MLVRSRFCCRICIPNYYSLLHMSFISHSTTGMNCKEPTALFSCPADATLISLWDGVSGTIGVLTRNENYESDTTGIQIDTLVVSLTNRVDAMVMISVSWSRQRDFCAFDCTYSGLCIVHWAENKKKRKNWWAAQQCIADTPVALT
jgi:hypothetical protein